MVSSESEGLPPAAPADLGNLPGLHEDRGSQAACLKQDPARALGKLPAGHRNPHVLVQQTYESYGSMSGMVMSLTVVPCPGRTGLEGWQRYEAPRSSGSCH